MFIVRKSPENPILAPEREHPWEALAAFNPSVVKTDKGVRMYYRALANPSAIIAPFAPQSTIGMAESVDGTTFVRARQVIAPTEAWEAFGCEDPRATVIDGITYLSYTALGGFPYGPQNIKVAIAVSNDGETFTERHLATPFNAKAFALFPEKVGGKYAALLTVHSDMPPSAICLALAERIEDYWSPAYWNTWYADWQSHALTFARSDQDHVEAGAIPVKTKEGWLFFYSYIQKYFGSEKNFSIEAALLDADNPQKVISRTYPFLVPEEIYERFGVAPDIVFPTSALIEGDQVHVYYGAADTTCAKASIRLSDLMRALGTSGEDRTFTRAKENPILEPLAANPFEEKLAFNPAAVDLDGSVHIIYRAMDNENTSTMGYARSKDGIHIDERLPVSIYGPRAAFEMKLGAADGNSGCEDPRAVVIGDMLYMTYTAYDGVHPPEGAISAIKVEDFLAHNFDTWTEPLLLTPALVDDKDLALLPAKVDGNFLLYHRINGRICADTLPNVLAGKRVSKCIEIMGPRTGMWDAAKVGIAGPPIQIPKGIGPKELEGHWVMLYHGVSMRKRYRVGAVLLDPSGMTVLSRTADPIFEPVADYEINGEIQHVVFPCGTVLRGDTLYMYYGGADKVVGVATASFSRIVDALR